MPIGPPVPKDTQRIRVTHMPGVWPNRPRKNAVLEDQHDQRRPGDVARVGESEAIEHAEDPVDEQRAEAAAEPGRHPVPGIRDVFGQIPLYHEIKPS